MENCDFAKDDFVFTLCALANKGGKGIPKSVSLVVSVMTAGFVPVVHGNDLSAATARIERALLGGPIRDSAPVAYPTGDGDAILMWEASFDPDRLGIHPEVERSIRNEPAEDPVVLYYRMEGERAILVNEIEATDEATDAAQAFKGTIQ